MGIGDTLQQRQRFGIHLGLERIVALLDRLDNPQRRFRAVHVAGTNGKGSVCAYVSEILRSAGYRTGRYTSPHLVRWHERIWIAGEEITDAQLTEAVAAAEEAAAYLPLDLGEPTQFELFTAAAFWHFARARIDIGVIEVGLGGRLDATNVFAAPLVTAITSIGYDHCDRLGNTLAAIAAEKAGILRPGVPVVCAPLVPEAMAVVETRSAALKAPLRVAQPARSLGGSTAECEGLVYRLPLAGPFQLQNSATALAICRVLGERGLPVGREALEHGLAATRWPGRVQWLQPDLLIDGAHNLEAAFALRQYLDAARPGAPVHWVIGILKSKDAPAMLAALLRPGDDLTAVPVPATESYAGLELVALAEALGVTARTAPDLAEALASRPAGLTVVAGSLYLVGAVLARSADSY